MLVNNLSIFCTIWYPQSLSYLTHFSTLNRSHRLRQSCPQLISSKGKAHILNLYRIKWRWKDNSSSSSLMQAGKILDFHLRLWKRHLFCLNDSVVKYRISGLWRLPWMAGCTRNKVFIQSALGAVKRGCVFSK